MNEPTLTGSLPSNYSRLSRARQIGSIWDALADLGFDTSRLTESLAGKWITTALDSFNAATIVQVFGLAQILADNQPLTVRGAMYRGIGKLWPDSSEPNYNKCARLILGMRRSGLIPYKWIVDGTRVSDKPSSWSGLADYAEAVAESYRKDLWERQEDYIEVFVEKDAMSGIIQPVTRQYDIQLNPIRGFPSETFLWNIAQEWLAIDKPIHVYYLGDHDPAGLKIEDNLRSKLTEFSGKTVFWKRLAITNEDFRSDLLGFQVKKKAAAGSWQPYLEQYGDRCVEVDAIPAREIRQRVKDSIESHIDQRKWQFLKEQEQREKQDVLAMVRNLGSSQQDLE